MTYLSKEVAIQADAGTSVIVQAASIAALLVGIEINPSCLGCR